MTTNSDYLEIERLRGLIKQAEKRGCLCGLDPEIPGCPWCERGPTDAVWDDRPRGDREWLHADDCPAFTPRGAVR